jgi:hypothetical protein
MAAFGTLNVTNSVVFRKERSIVSIIKQYRQCTYNVTMRRFRESLLPWKSNKYYIFVCVRADVRVYVRMWLPGSVGVWMLLRAYRLAYPACNSHPPRCDVICGPNGSTVFFNIISWRHNFRITSYEHKMCVLIFSTTFVQNISPCMKNSAKYFRKCRNIFM